MEIKVAKVFKPLFDNCIERKHTDVLLKSGRTGGKSAVAGQVIAVLSTAWADRDMIICRDAFADLRDSSFAEIQSWLEDMQLGEEFQIHLNPMRIINTRSNCNIYFFGIGGEDKHRTKSIKTKHKVGAIIFEELQQVKDRESLEQAKSSFRRLLDPDRGFFIHLFNPEPQNGHWVNMLWNLKISDPDWLCIQSSWMDITKCLNDLDIKAILKEKFLDPARYEWFYMGKTGGGFGSVYPEFKREKHLISRNPILATNLALEQQTKYQYDTNKMADLLTHKIIGVIIGYDQAVTHDMTVLVPIFILSNGQAIVSGRDIFYHDPKVLNSLGTVELMPHISLWLKKMSDWYGFERENVPIMFIVDSAATETLRILRANMPDRIGVFPIHKPSIVGMVDIVKGVLARNMIYIIDDGYHMTIKGQTKQDNLLASQLENLIWLAKPNGDTPTTYDPKIPNDCSDAFTYAVNWWWRNPMNMYWVGGNRLDFYDIR